ncbi:Stk1 family PASTA domain-containing Ser/Thr kinase [Micromonospora sp. NPDC048999]|uniref:Stk1 family PASTA domain-containing Ser/Thr kinase n=1 Tax=Micromonospora sp. NPDC048999 TaxID=3155391 RepID=UPI0033D63E1C
MTAQARLLGGRYQVGELLGYGGMAEVHRGRDLRLGRDVAIKMLRADLARDATFQMRFRREAQNAASLNHPAIVAVYDTGEETAPTGETLPFIVMEFVNGRTLKEVLGVEGRLQPRRALEICADMCAALEFSHRHGIIHRDIKPGNVMLTQTGQVKVMDFGIARALASGATTMTQTSAVIGTAQYLSPEQARGEAVDARSDVYAAGCVLFELLCGHPPFVGDSPVSVAYQHVRETPPTPSTINPDVNPAVDAIVLKALSKNPLNRYQSAGEMRADLLRAAAGRPVLATPVMPVDETMPMAPAAGAAGYQTQVMGPQTRQQVPARVGDPRKRRSSAWVIASFAGLGVLAVIALVGALLMQNRVDSVEVPRVQGMSVADASSEIQRLGLIPVPGEPVLNATCEKGKVVEQSPDPGTALEKGQNVTYQVCNGPNKVKIPPVVGNRYENVKEQLEGLGFIVDPDYVDDSAPKDQVLGTDPKQGTEVDEASTIKVKVSNGNVSEVPNVFGFSKDEAIRTLKAAGYNNVNVRDGDEKPAEQAGKVSSQTPKAGTKLPKDKAITIYVDIPAPESSETPTETPTTDQPGGPGTGGGFPFPDVSPPRQLIP